MTHHLICPLFKRGSAFMAGNYRGIHLTPILSKVAEKVIGKNLLDFLYSGSFGIHQWAFIPGLSARDLVTALVLSWILAICTGYKIAGYLGDITGAFDRVFKDYLLAKLQAAGIGPTYLNFLDSYLQPRIAQVVVEGVASEEFTIENQVFPRNSPRTTAMEYFFQRRCPLGGLYGGGTINVCRRPKRVSEIRQVGK